MGSLLLSLCLKVHLVFVITGLLHRTQWHCQRSNVRDGDCTVQDIESRRAPLLMFNPPRVSSETVQICSDCSDSKSQSVFICLHYISLSMALPAPPSIVQTWDRFASPAAISHRRGERREKPPSALPSLARPKQERVIPRIETFVLKTGQTNLEHVQEVSKEVPKQPPWPPVATLANLQRDWPGPVETCSDGPHLDPTWAATCSTHTPSGSA